MRCRQRGAGGSTCSPSPTSCWQVSLNTIGRKLTGALLTISAPITRTSAKNPPNGLKKIRRKWRSTETTPSPAQKKQLQRPGKHRVAFLFEYLHNTKGIA